MPKPRKFPEAAQRLRHDISEGVFTSDKLPNQGELARRYGVTLVTMRKAILELTAAGLLYAKPYLGTYIAPRHFGRLRAGNLRETGLLIRDLFSLRHPYISRMLDGLHETMRESDGQHLQVITMPGTGAGRTGSIDRLRQMCRQDILHALALHAWFTPEEVSFLWDLGVPMVSIGRRYPGNCPCVMQDTGADAATLAGFFTQNGCRAVAILRGFVNPAARQTNTDVGWQCVDILTAAGIAAGGDMVYTHADEEELDETAASGILTNMLARHPEVDGLLLAAPAFPAAFRVWRESASARPLHVAAITDGSVDLDIPALRLPITEIGREAGKLLLGQMANGRESVTSRFVPSIWI